MDTQAPQLTLRNTTQGIQAVFVAYGQNAAYLHTDCPICLRHDLNTDEIVQIKPCDHYCCETCMQGALERNQDTCFSCRNSINTIFTINSGEESVDEFVDRLNPTVFHLPMRQLTCGAQHYGASSELDIQSRHMQLLPSYPVAEIIRSGVIFGAFHVTESAVGAGCVSFISSANDTDTSPQTDIIIILDRSGSMLSILNLAKLAIISLLQNLKSSQRVTVLIFDDEVEQLFPLQYVNSTNRDQIITKVQAIEARGGTRYVDSIRMAKKVFDQANSSIGRDQLVVFLSDGQPDPGYGFRADVMESLSEAYPRLITHTVSLGNSVNAELQLARLVIGTGQYFPCSDGNFEPILLQILGEDTGVYATDLQITIRGAKPLTSLARQIESAHQINVPVFRMDEAINIAFIVDANADALAITYSFTLASTGMRIEGHSILDVDGTILPPSIAIFYPRSKMLKEKINKVLECTRVSSIVNQQLLTLLAELTTAGVEFYGEYYNELLSSLTGLIESFSNTRNMESANRATSITMSLQRHTSDGSTSRQVSQGLRLYTQMQPETDNEEKDDEEN